MKYLRILSNSKSQGDKDWGYVPHFFTFISSVLWTIGWIYPNQHKINFAETSIVRGFSLVVFNYIMCRYFAIPIDFKKPKIFKYLTTRAIIMTVHGFVFSLSQFILPLPVVHAINDCAALFVFVIDYYINGVKTNCAQNIGISVGLVGVLLATNGTLITKYFFNSEYKYKTNFQNYITEDIILISLFSILYLAVVFLWAFAIVLTKRCQSNTFQINYILGISFVIGGGAIYPFVESSCSVIDMVISFPSFGFILVLVNWFYIGGLTMSKDHGVLAMMGFSSILTGFVISIIRYEERPTIITILGVCLLFYGMWKAVKNTD